MLRYIDSTPIFTREAPSLTYSEHLTSQTLQATFFFEPKDFASRPPPPADRRSGQIFSSRPMSPLRCTVASETFSKSCDGNPMENFFIGDFDFFGRKKHTAEKNTPLPWKAFHRGRKVFADPAAGGLLAGPDVFTPIHSRLRFFSKSQRKSPTESFFIGKLFFRPIADPAKFFRAVPCFHSDTLSRPRFFLSPAWEIPWKTFHRGRKVSADPAAGGLLAGPDVFTPIHCRLRNFF